MHRIVTAVPIALNLVGQLYVVILTLEMRDSAVFFLTSGHRFVAERVQSADCDLSLTRSFLYVVQFENQSLLLFLVSRSVDGARAIGETTRVCRNRPFLTILLPDQV